MTELDFPLSGDDQEDKFPGDDRQEPQKPKEQWVYCPEGQKELYKKNSYKLACFIMGCLIQEEVVQTADHNAFDCSDMAVGIRIIATCLEGNLAEGFTNLPFEW